MKFDSFIKDYMSQLNEAPILPQGQQQGLNGQQQQQQPSMGDLLKFALQMKPEELQKYKIDINANDPDGKNIMSQLYNAMSAAQQNAVNQKKPTGLNTSTSSAQPQTASTTKTTSTIGQPKTTSGGF